jgi:AcrR family transcriptional regulator
MADDTEGLRARKRRRLKADLSRKAIELFERHGFDQTTIDDIVGPLGISTRTFFRYFAAKEDAVFGWYEELSDELVTALAARPKGERPYESVCEALCSLTHYYDDNRAWVLSTMTLVKRTPSLEAKSREKRAYWERALAATLEERLAKTRTRSLRARVIVGAALNAFGYGIDDWIAARAKGDPRAFLYRAFSFIEEAS